MDALSIEEFHIEGVAPLLLHNGRLADPVNEWAKTLKQLTSKRLKSDEIHAEISRIEWYGSLYTNAKNEVCVTSSSIEAMFIAAARKRKLGKNFESSMHCPDEDYPLIYNGPKDIDKLWAKTEFRDRRCVGVNKNRTARTRPRFNAWQLQFRVQYDTSEINREELLDVAEIAGRLIGLCDYRPKFGRFEIL